MTKVEGITIDVGIDDKTKLRLRAIAKHTEVLDDELDRIDSAWSCSNCGHDTKATYYYDDERGYTQCEACGTLVDDELPRRLEGSD
ncbi:hypothetical protein [Lysinibacillus xylanilyticus]|uniref:hypothetical protein n=1 Tax=Lysinibacillus xylanilyticus TaxID=582475 RepID=UPI003D02DD96